MPGSGHGAGQNQASTTQTAGAGGSAAVGFADQAHLTRWFRRYYGITPGEYRAASQAPAA